MFSFNTHTHTHLSISFFCPLKAYTVLMAESTSSATAPALAYALCSLVVKFASSCSSRERSEMRRISETNAEFFFRFSRTAFHNLMFKLTKKLHLFNWGTRSCESEASISIAFSTWNSYNLTLEQPYTSLCLQLLFVYLSLNRERTGNTWSKMNYFTSFQGYYIIYFSFDDQATKYIILTFNSCLLAKGKQNVTLLLWDFF